MCSRCLVKREGFVGRFYRREVSDPEAQTLLSKVEILHPEEYNEDPMSLAQEVVLKLSKGAEYSYKVDTPKGDLRIQ